MNVLIVEDQMTPGLALSGTLARLGYEPRLITAGAAAWDLIECQDWRLIITDWLMPDVDGLELCRRIRQRRGRPYIYVIMLTCRTDAVDRLEGLKAGADDFLTKPVNEEELALRLAIAERILGVQTQLEEKNARLEAMVGTDPLTGLANRRRLSEVMGRLWCQARPVHPCAVVALDIDHFKAYNDSFGHAAGDEVLRIVAEILRSGTRPSDLLVRTGGEEFLIVLPGMGSNEALMVADRLRRAIAVYPWPVRPVTASFGVTVASSSARTVVLAELLEAADRALYHSKSSGRNRVTHSHFLPKERPDLPGVSPLANDRRPARAWKAHSGSS
jgi:two-component system chemotaxis response regulator CheY